MATSKQNIINPSQRVLAGTKVCPWALLQGQSQELH